MSFLLGQQTRCAFTAKQVFSLFKVTKSSSHSNQLLLRKRLPASTYTCNQEIWSGKHEISSDYNLLYEGPWAQRFKYLRWGLLSGALLGAQINPAALCIGLGTTFMVHKRTKGYVNQLYFDPKKKNVLLFTWSLIGVRHPKFFNINEASNVTERSFTVGTDTYLIHLGTKEASHVMDIMAGKVDELEEE